MKKNIELTVNSKDELLNYLLHNIEGKSKNNIKSMLSRGNVEVNGKVVTRHDYILNVGQKIVIKVAKILNNKKDESIDIIYEDRDIIVINKPAGLLSISTEDEKNNTAYKMVMEYMKTHNHGSKLFIVHRLDRDTSGVLLFAKNEKIKYYLQDNWDEIVKLRGYIAIVEGNVEKDKGTIKSWLKETKTMLMYSSNKHDDGDFAITHFTKISSNKEYSLLEVKIDTGRKNQIRVHMNDMGHPIVGDKKYGSIKNPLKRLGLHANVLEVNINNKLIHFEAKVPNTFYGLLRKK
jgi:23S rRNA pseudouridine1911/1915/1917 synthase